MGKLGKRLKRKNIDEFQKVSYEDINDDGSQLVADEDSLDKDIICTIKTLTRLLEEPDLFNSKKFRGIRSLLHSLYEGKGTGYSARISLALREGRWNEAIYLLKEMRDRKQIPKLGALQRWVRDCDAASEFREDISEEVWKTLDAILRTTNGMSDQKIPVVKTHEPWSPLSDRSAAVVTSADDLFCINETFYRDKFKMVHTESGDARTPPNRYDMNLFASDSDTVKLLEHADDIRKIDVPNVPGAFVLTNVLHVSECKQIISAAESMGFCPDEPISGSAANLNSILAHNFFWLADETLLQNIFERCKAFLPQIIENDCNQQVKITGLNARWRVYRYSPGSIYRPHIDGAWPGSSLDSDGNYQFDGFGDRFSKLTFLIRLNHGFLGGETSFFTPNSDKVGVLDCWPVAPFAGDVLVFPHGDCRGTLLHEGSAVFDSHGERVDAKYVIRTEVLYTLPESK